MNNYPFVVKIYMYNGAEPAMVVLNYSFVRAHSYECKESVLYIISDMFDETRQENISKVTVECDAPNERFFKTFYTYFKKTLDLTEVE